MKGIKVTVIIAMLMVLILINSSQSQEKKEAKKTFVLYQNEATGLSNVTCIKFDLKSESYVKLSVFDLKGNLVEELVRGQMDPGSYNVYYKSGNDIQENELTYRIEAGGMGESRIIRQTK